MEKAIAILTRAKRAHQVKKQLVKSHSRKCGAEQKSWEPIFPALTSFFGSLNYLLRPSTLVAAISIVVVVVDVVVVVVVFVDPHRHQFQIK